MRYLADPRAKASRQMELKSKIRFVVVNSIIASAVKKIDRLTSLRPSHIVSIIQLLSVETYHDFFNVNVVFFLFCASAK